MFSNQPMIIFTIRYSVHRLTFLYLVFRIVAPTKNAHSNSIHFATPQPSCYGSSRDFSLSFAAAHYARYLMALRRRPLHGCLSAGIDRTTNPLGQSERPIVYLICLFHISPISWLSRARVWCGGISRYALEVSHAFSMLSPVPLPYFTSCQTDTRRNRLWQLLRGGYNSHILLSLIMKWYGYNAFEIFEPS